MGWAFFRCTDITVTNQQDKMIQSNPFLSHTFLSYWSKHFLTDQKTRTFCFVKNLLFYKSKCPGLYINTGKNLTKGINYELNGEFSKEAKGKTLFIYDVIDVLGKEAFLKKNAMGLYSVRQYPGFLIELGAYQTLDDFVSRTFKKSSRYKLRKYKKRLEECFNISFKAYNDELSKEGYDAIFDDFRRLLEKRFSEKKISNNNLAPKEWNFYKDVAYPMIKEKKATLFVLYNNDEAISITLAYMSENRVFDAITVFDIDYAKFHLGSIKIMYLIDWCLKNNWDVLDFSKGHFDYKLRWSNRKFDFHYHILYDKNSLWARILSFTLMHFFTFKQYLREKRFNESLYKLTYVLRNKKEKYIDYSFLEWDGECTDGDLKPVDINTAEYAFLKGICNDFLYLHQEHVQNLNVLKVDKTEDFFLLVGQNKKIGLKLMM